MMARVPSPNINLCMFGQGEKNKTNLGCQAYFLLEMTILVVVCVWGGEGQKLWVGDLPWLVRVFLSMQEVLV